MSIDVNNSLLSLLNTCETATWARWGRELVMQESQGPGPREVGQVLHAAMEAYFQGQLRTEIEARFAGAWHDIIGDELPKAERLQRHNVELVLGYWLDAMQLRPYDWTVIATEQQFEVPLGTVSGEEVIYYGTPDMLIEWKGDLYVVDNKTTGSIDEDWAQSWQMSAQLQGYVWAYRQQGYKVKGAFVNGLEVNRLPPWDGNLQKKCSVHKLKYEQCQAAHVRHRWVGPLWWSTERLAVWHKNALAFVHDLLPLRHEALQDVTMDGQFKWPGCSGGRGRPPCSYRPWCMAGRPTAGLTQMMVHSDWKGPLKEVEIG